MTRLSHRTLYALALCFGLIITDLPAARAQSSATQPTETRTLSPNAIADKIKPLHPKTVAFVFDVTMSTRHGGVFELERAATATILREGCLPGDHVVLLKFGTGYTPVFDQTLATHEDALKLIDDIPGAPEPGRGTNIRYPHERALEIVQDGLPSPGVIVLLTDSFNDQPVTTDPNYPNYTAYYSPKGLTTYPDTPENRQYEDLLRTLMASGKLHEFGVGVAIASTGRPIERVPVTPDESDAPDAVAQAVSLQSTATAPEKQIGDRPFVVIGCFAVIIIGLIWAALALGRPTTIRLGLGDKSTPRDYRLKSGARVCLGGSLSSCRPGDDFFPLAGLAEPAAYVAASGGGAVLSPSGPGSDRKIYHNGALVEQQAPLRYGDEIKITVPDPSSTIPRDFRVKFVDPKAPLF